MQPATITRIAALYLPLVVALMAALLRARRPRRFAACLLSLLWTLPALAILLRLNQFAGWWSFSGHGPSFLGTPVELYLGWVILWGLVPQLVFERLELPETFVVMVSFDLLLMPLDLVFAQRTGGQLQLSNQWLIGEAAAAILVLAPALCIARWTLHNTQLNLRATLQVALSGMLFLFLVPEIVFAMRPGLGWTRLLHMRSWERQLGIQFLLILALPGVSAVMDFAQRGSGTPIPYDPPQRLVTSGVYRYCANPMQLSCGLVMLFWALLLHNLWFALAACTSIIYSAGIAEWDEDQDLTLRFGAAWKHYHAAMPAWRLRWRPLHSGPAARLYIARTCGPCSELRTWLASRHPLGLDFIDAETLLTGSIQRLRYDPADGTPTENGIRAFARALEHLNLGWALCGAALRLPIVWQSIQLLMDASGLGPRVPGQNLSSPSPSANPSKHA